jgi:hypothetical protein
LAMQVNLFRYLNFNSFFTIALLYRTNLRKLSEDSVTDRY